MNPSDPVPTVGAVGLLGMIGISTINQYIAACVGLVTIGYTLHRWVANAKNGWRNGGEK